MDFYSWREEKKKERKRKLERDTEKDKMSRGKRSIWWKMEMPKGNLTICLIVVGLCKLSLCLPMNVKMIFLLMVSEVGSIFTKPQSSEYGLNIGIEQE